MNGSVHFVRAKRIEPLDIKLDLFPIRKNRLSAVAGVRLNCGSELPWIDNTSSLLGRDKNSVAKLALNDDDDSVERHPCQLG